MDLPVYFFFFFFNDTATTEIYTLSLHDALPISAIAARAFLSQRMAIGAQYLLDDVGHGLVLEDANVAPADRKSTRLNSSHLVISYAVFCLKKKSKEVSRGGKIY